MNHEKLPRPVSSLALKHVKEFAGDYMDRYCDESDQLEARRLFDDLVSQVTLMPAVESYRCSDSLGSALGFDESAPTDQCRSVVLLQTPSYDDGSKIFIDVNTRDYDNGDTYKVVTIQCVDAMGEERDTYHYYTEGGVVKREYDGDLYQKSMNRFDQEVIQEAERIIGKDVESSRHEYGEADEWLMTGAVSSLDDTVTVGPGEVKALTKPCREQPKKSCSMARLRSALSVRAQTSVSW